MSSISCWGKDTQDSRFKVDKYKKLRSIIIELESVVLAFSGGVDSTLLAKAIKDSGIKCLLVTAFSETMPESELRHATQMAVNINIPHLVIKTDELANPLYTANTVDRCFYCKDELYGRLRDIAESSGYKHVIDGSNADDISDWRPGMKAAKLHNVRSPLMEAGLTKNEIRDLSSQLGLPTWSKPSSPCLSSRFPYGVEITREALGIVDKAEAFLKNYGFIEVRVRYYRTLASIEVREDDFSRLLEGHFRESLVEYFKSLGFKHVALDMEGFRSGKLNDAVDSG